MLTHSKELKAQLSELSEFGGTNFGKKFFSNTKSTDYLNNAPIEETINFATPPIAANEHFSLQTGDQRGATSTQTRHPIIDQTPPTTMMGALENEWIDFKTQFNKSYPTPEMEFRRRQNFFTNRIAISIYNQNHVFGRSNFVLKINSFADLLVEEFNQIFNGFRGGNQTFNDPSLQPTSYINPINIQRSISPTDVLH
ncbi:Cathepsin propeptide inhibitor domain (I29) [Popillia japonica]|uniref:Cathepsin propeptide inhibitor domain (I29) n=1 Tax=Popillia japonica TaxID=7064 RepID=A0AAW1JCZ9_POPJA